MHFLTDKLFWLAIALVVASLLGVAVALELDAPAAAAAGILLAALGLGFVSLRTTRTAPAADDDAGPVVSLVLLLKEPRYLDATILAHAASRAWNAEIGTEEAESFVVGESPHFVLKWMHRLFVVHNLPEPYFDDVDKRLHEIRDLRMQQIVREHQAWFSVDQMAPPEDEQAYPNIGRLLAELYDDSCLAVFHPAQHRGYPTDDNTLQILSGGRPLEELEGKSYVPVLALDDEDPRLQAAVAEARRRWPEFVEAFERRDAAERFAVKAPISDGTATEFMWMLVTGIENDVIYGKLDNNPLQVKREAGDTLRIPLADVHDWVYSNDEELFGFFSRSLFEDPEH